ncbi:MAG: phosphatase [Syntrophaceticus sp.]|nr:phosphatase [Syntrophaceticus sp.]
MKLEADLHTHTIASGHAYSTVKELVDAAQEKGLQMIGITDHGPRMAGAPGLDHFWNTHVWPRQVNGVQILRGVEANILDTEGSLDVPDEILERLDIVLAGFHGGTGYIGSTVEENTKAMVAVLQKPLVHIITHPGNPQYPIDYERVVLAAQEYGKALEINNSTFMGIRPQSYEPCLKIATLAREYGVSVAVNSDAHICYQVGDCPLALEIIHKAGNERSSVLNTSAVLVQEFLARHGRHII